MKKLSLTLLALQLIATSALFAQDKDAALKGCCHGSSNNGATEPAGKLYRGYGPNLDPSTAGTLVKCALYGEKGTQVGTTATYAVSEGVVRHHWDLKCGSLDIVVESTLAYVTSPLDESVIISFPELAPYLNNPDAGLLTFESNATKGSSVVQSWVGTGKLKKINYVEFRCVYLTINGNITQCLGCHWFFGN